MTVSSEPISAADTGGPLAGLRVVEFTSAWAGPYATCLLGFMGAEVIKVESRKRIDHSRITSFTTSRVFEGPDASPVFDNLNLNKASVCLDLSRPEAVAIAKRLISASDVVVENMRPGVIERLGLGYAAARQAHAGIVYLSSSACGQTGPDRENVGYAPNFASAAGLSYVTGYPDWPPSTLAGSIDLRSACSAAFAILAALIHRQRSGQGQYIDLASQEVIAMLNADALLDFAMNGRSRTREGNRDDAMAPHDCYRCSGDDEWVSIAVASDEEWSALCRVLASPQLACDERFATATARLDHRPELDAVVAEWTKRHSANEATRLLQAAGVAAAPSMSNRALFEDPHLRARGVFQQVEHPVIGTDWVVGPPWRFSETPAAVRRASPLLGEHNNAVFGGLLGMPAEEIRRLEQDGVIN